MFRRHSSHYRSRSDQKGKPPQPLLREEGGRHLEMPVESVLVSNRHRGQRFQGLFQYVPNPGENISTERWEKLKEALVAKYEVLEKIEEPYDEGTGSREVIVVAGKLGKTRFEYVLRHRTPEDPKTMTFAQPYDWVYDGQLISSRLRVQRWDEASQDWKEVALVEVFGIKN